MNSLVQRLLLSLCFLFAVGCTSGSGVSESVTPNTALYDPTTSTVPLPNILATATAKDPITQFTDPSTGNVDVRPAATGLNPLESLAYIATHEVLPGSNAVAGLNAPIYIRFAGPLVPSTVNGSNIKVFQLATDTPLPTSTENSALGFTDVTAMFSFNYTAGGTEVSLFPNFPLLPATRYLYLVTDRVKDAATGGSVAGSIYFEALKSTSSLAAGAFAALEPIRADVTGTGGILLRGYQKVMDDLIASPASSVTSRSQIALLGRFITTTAGFVAQDATNPVSSIIPVESALYAFAAGTELGGLTGKSWLGAGLNVATVDAPGVTPNQFWTAASGGAITTAPASVGAVITGTIASGDISMNPVAAHNSPTTMNLGVLPGTYSPNTAVVQPFRDNTGKLTGYYYTPRAIPYVYIAPATAAPAGGYPLVIFQHGINGQKEQVIAVAQALTSAGFAVVAIDLPLHGALAVTGHTSTVWGQDFMALGFPLASRSNIQQAAFNLDRLELTVKTAAIPGFGAQGFGPLGTNAPNPAIKPKYVGISLGSIVGTYYLAGNTTLSGGAVPPYTQTSLNGDMKGLLSVPGGRIAYLLRDSVSFGPAINAGLLASGIQTGSPTYNQFFQLTQTVLDSVDPATMTTPLPNLQTADLLPSRLSGRTIMQEATSTSFDASGKPTNGDLVIPNANTRYLGNALGGRTVLGTAAAAAVAPGFDQLSYLSGRVPATFMFTISGGALAPKVATAAASPAAVGPTEGYFQFDQSDVTHGFLIDLVHSPTSLQLAQKQMVDFLLTGAVVDPTSPTAKPVPGIPSGAGISYVVQPPAVMRIGK
jgi:hypothetical protein